MRPDAAQAYLQQLVYLCEIWEKLRLGLSFAKAQELINQISPDIAAVLQHEDPQLARYFLIGSLASKQESLDDYLIREGQQKEDLEPEALVVGEQGMLLGRFSGTWKLMSTNCREDLLGVWGLGDTAYMVGCAGTVLKLEQGKCTTLEVPTTQRLNAIWGLSATSICAVGENGTAIVFDGQSWQPWTVPSDVEFYGIAGTGPDNICISGQEPALMRYDGYAWNKIPLPDQTIISQLCAVGETIYAAGGSSKGGELFQLRMGECTRALQLPHAEWIIGLWRGWGKEVGVMPSSGEPYFNSGSEWEGESIGTEEMHGAAGGAKVFTIGRIGRHSVIMVRTQQGWQVDASLPNLKLHQIWVAGNPKPPRMVELPDNA